MSSMGPPPLSLYVHLPWCVSKCPYCDFNSHAAADGAPRERYLAALMFDLDCEAEHAPGRPLISVFIGGGTPSLFSAGEIGSLIDMIAARFSLLPDVEITMEANPGTLERGNIGDYATAGVTRLSLGVQSFDAVMLKRIGRIHGPREIHSAYAHADAAGFDSINVDLMFALPGQNAETAIRDVEQAIALGPAHVSYYQLTLEPNTVFYASPPAGLPDEAQSAAIQAAGQARLASAGYERYEISAFAKPGHRCRHNLNYWDFGDYLAAGAGAHGKVTTPDGRIRRYEKPRHPLTYIEQAEAGSIDGSPRTVPVEDLAFEYMLNALRLPGGFAAADYQARTGQPIGQITSRLDAAQALGMIRPVGDAGWRPTELGLRFQNDLVALFLP